MLKNRVQYVDGLKSVTPRQKSEKGREMLRRCLKALKVAASNIRGGALATRQKKISKHFASAVEKKEEVGCKIAKVFETCQKGRKYKKREKRR